MLLHLISFSPTGTTRKIVETIAAGFAAEQIERYDLTRMAEPPELQLDEGCAVIGIPVYAGRVPEVCLQRLAGITAEGIPAVLVAVYGNREYEGALVELRDIVTTAGFSVVAGGAFIGEHSYSTDEQPIAAGRPDQSDLNKAKVFGRQVAQKLAKDPICPELAGNTPYRERVKFGGIAPQTDPATCTLCGRCVEVCPMFVVTVDQQVSTAAERCVMCCACSKSCPTGARSMDHPFVQQRRQMLQENCRQRKEPTLFL